MLSDLEISGDSKPAALAGGECCELKPAIVSRMLCAASYGRSESALAKQSSALAISEAACCDGGVSGRSEKIADAMSFSTVAAAAGESSTKMAVQWGRPYKYVGIALFRERRNFLCHGIYTAYGCR